MRKTSQFCSNVDLVHSARIPITNSDHLSFRHAHQSSVCAVKLSRALTSFAGAFGPNSALVSAVPLVYVSGMTWGYRDVA